MTVLSGAMGRGNKNSCHCLSWSWSSCAAQRNQEVLLPTFLNATHKDIFTVKQALGESFPGSSFPSQQSGRPEQKKVLVKLVFRCHVLSVRSPMTQQVHSNSRPPSAAVLLWVPRSREQSVVNTGCCLSNAVHMAWGDSGASLLTSLLLNTGKLLIGRGRNMGMCGHLIFYLMVSVQTDLQLKGKERPAKANIRCVTQAEAINFSLVQRP